jgi:hypothetical protein
MINIQKHLKIIPKIKASVKTVSNHFSISVVVASSLTFGIGVVQEGEAVEDVAEVIPVGDVVAQALLELSKILDERSR